MPEHAFRRRSAHGVRFSTPSTTSILILTERKCRVFDLLTTIFVNSFSSVLFRTSLTDTSRFRRSFAPRTTRISQSAFQGPEVSLFVHHTGSISLIKFLSVRDYTASRVSRLHYAPTSAYSLTLLSRLNSRQSIAARASSIEEDTTAFGTAVLSPIAFSGTRNSRLHTRSVRRLQIKYHTAEASPAVSVFYVLQAGITTAGHGGDAIELDLMPQHERLSHVSSHPGSSTKASPSYLSESCGMDGNV